MEWRVRRIVDNIWGPTGTVLIHALILALLVTFVRTGEMKSEKSVEAIVVETTPPEKLDELTKELQQLEELPTVVDAVAPPTVSIDQDPPSVDAVGTSADDSASDLSDLNMLESASPVVFKGLWVGRSSGGRSDALGKYSGGIGDRTESPC
jgi:hypothetical protein